MDRKVQDKLEWRRFLTFRQLEARARAFKEKVQQQKQAEHDSPPTF